MTLRTYLDHNASAPLRPAARQAMLAALDVEGNPSSIHAEGRAARAIIEGAREAVAKLAGAKVADVVFTSGGSEAITTAICDDAYETVVVSDIEHAAVLEAVAKGGARVIKLAVSGKGQITAVALDQALEAASATPGRGLVCLQLANNETGIIQDVSGLARQAKDRGMTVFCDAVQAAGRLPLDMDALGVDVLAISAHKIGGPKGVGALILAPGFQLKSLVSGGGQERRRRGGTENLSGIAGFGAAALEALAGLPDMMRLARLRDQCEAIAKEILPTTIVIGADVPRLANTSCLALPGRPAEMTVIKLDLAGLAVSSGAACSSGKVAKSRALTAMGMPDDTVVGAIRVSFGWNSSDHDLEEFSTAWATLNRTAAREGGVAVSVAQ